MASSTTEPGPAASPPADLIGVLEQGRRQFLALVEHVRPELHRYCTRMTGSAADGEDVVQETLARGYYELSQMKDDAALRPWLFRIAHNRAIDHWRHERAPRQRAARRRGRDRRRSRRSSPTTRSRGSRRCRPRLGSFLALAPAQRGCVILKDVLDHSLEEIAAELELSVPAVKAALHRGRAALRQQLDAAPAAPAVDARATSAALRRYASLFNAHDWDGVRGLLADDVRLDLVSHRKAAGRREVGTYFTNYERVGGWQLQPGWFEGREVLAVRVAAGAPPRYFIELGWRDGQVIADPRLPLRALHRPGRRVRARRRGLTLRPRGCRRRAGSRSAATPTCARNTRLKCAMLEKPKPSAISVIERWPCARSSKHWQQASSAAQQDVAGDAVGLLGEGVVQMAPAAVQRPGDAVDRRAGGRARCSATCCLMRSRSASRCVMAVPMPARSSIERCTSCVIASPTPRAAVSRHAGQLAVGDAHGLERQPGDAAAAAEAPRHQRLERHAALGQALLGHHHDQVLDAHRVGDGVAVGGVVDAPLVGRDPGLAALLLDAGAAVPRRDDLQVADLGRCAPACASASRGAGWPRAASGRRRRRAGWRCGRRNRCRRTGRT